MTEAPLRLIKVPTQLGEITVDLHKLQGIEYEKYDNRFILVLDGGGQLFGHFRDESDVVKLQELWFDWTESFNQPVSGISDLIKKISETDTEADKEEAV